MRSKVNRKRTIGEYQFLGSSLVCWNRSEQHYVALSFIKAEYVAIGGSVTQISWIKHTLKEYDLEYKNVQILCDNIETITLRKNLTHYSRIYTGFDIMLLEIT